MFVGESRNILVVILLNELCSVKVRLVVKLISCLVLVLFIDIRFMMIGLLLWNCLLMV